MCIRGPARYLEFFTRHLRAQVSVDLLQSEQGMWFYHKRNRNMVVETTENVPALDNFRWFSLGELPLDPAHDRVACPERGGLPDAPVQRDPARARPC